jgi:hypothetical protein
MEQTINIADLVQPKFKAGQTVWVASRDYHSRIQSIRTMNIKQIGFLVSITNEKGIERRAVTLQYIDNQGNPYVEDCLFASLNDLSEIDRKPLVG